MSVSQTRGERTELSACTCHRSTLDCARHGEFSEYGRGRRVVWPFVVVGLCWLVAVAAFLHAMGVFQ